MVKRYSIPGYGSYTNSELNALTMDEIFDILQDLGVVTQTIYEKYLSTPRVTRPVLADSTRAPPSGSPARTSSGSSSPCGCSGGESPHSPTSDVLYVI